MQSNSRTQRLPRCKKPIKSLYLPWKQSELTVMLTPWKKDARNPAMCASAILSPFLEIF